MVDNEKRDNLVNARRKVRSFILFSNIYLWFKYVQLKKFRDQQQQQQQNGDDHLTFISETNGHNIHSSNGVWAFVRYYYFSNWNLFFHRFQMNPTSFTIIMRTIIWPFRHILFMSFISLVLTISHKIFPLLSMINKRS